MGDYVVEVYETNDGVYRLPSHLKGGFRRLGWVYRLIQSGDAGAGPYSFCGDDISGSVGSRQVSQKGTSHGLILEVHTNNPRPESQQDAVTLLLRKLPMFNSKPTSREIVPERPKSG